MERATAGTAWLLQFIEDLQQSREFHKTCELKLTRKQASTIPEVRTLLAEMVAHTNVAEAVPGRELSIEAPAPFIRLRMCRSRACRLFS